MTNPSRGPRHFLLICGILISIAAGGCSAGGQHGETTSAQGASQPSATTGDASRRAGSLPSKHVHGIARNPADSQIYLATHDGLFRIHRDGPPIRIGPVIDLMGFAVAGPNHFYASGHPGPGVKLPNPVGLLESRDGGQTWTPLSRQGQSDFHSLASSQAGIVGFDGKTVSLTTDGRGWRQLTPPVEPHAVAASPDGSTLLVTSRQGLTRSPDQGRTWQPVETAVRFQLVAWADSSTAVGVAADGQVAISLDAALTWQVQKGLGAAPHALTAHRSSDNGLEIIAATAGTLVRSTDNGTTFMPYAG
jgi:hypothetical protein